MTSARRVSWAARVSIPAPWGNVTSTFWTSHVSAVLDAFESHGVTVNRTPKRIGFWRTRDE